MVVALLSLFCLLAPGAAPALGNAASCLMHQSGKAAASHEHGEMHHHHADAGNAPQQHTKHQHDGKGSPGPCGATLRFGDREAGMIGQILVK